MKRILLSLVVLSSFILNEITAEPTDSKVEETMKDKINMLGQGNSFTYVDLGLANEELYLLDQLKFDKMPPQAATSYDCFGKLHLLKDELPAFISEIGNNDEEIIEAVTAIICRTVQHITKASNKDSAWVSVRVSTPTSRYDIPRWHIDGSYYGPFP